MATNGNNTIQTAQIHYRACAHCKKLAFLAQLVFEANPRGALLVQPPRGGAQQAGGPMQVTSHGIVSYGLCLHCLRRETWTPEGPDWNQTVDYEGLPELKAAPQEKT